jgi:prepilin-type N-terminal cleavage/methylation domain-containing protein
MKRGFTLIEMLVSVAIFTIAMVIALGALLAMSEGDRKAQTVKAVIDNLNFSLDSMSRSIRTGSNWGCGSQGGGDCTATPGTYFAFTDSAGNAVAYCLSGSTLMRAVAPNGGLISSACSTQNGFAPVTEPQVVITSLSFYLLGSGANDGLQPKLTILIAGYVQFKGSSATSCTGLTSSGASTCFALQSSVTQRLYDQ